LEEGVFGDIQGVVYIGNTETGDSNHAILQNTDQNPWHFMLQARLVSELTQSIPMVSIVSHVIASFCLECELLTKPLNGFPAQLGT
jgi:hypothetical protein